MSARRFVQRRRAPAVHDTVSFADIAPLLAEGGRIRLLWRGVWIVRQGWRPPVRVVWPHTGKAPA